MTPPLQLNARIINERMIIINNIAIVMTAYEETESLIPRIAFQMLLIILVASDIFILVCTQLDIGTQMWMFYATTLVFVAIALIFGLIRLHITIDDETITVGFLKMRNIPLSDIIDYKTGDVDILRNYSGWGSKSVKYKNYICNGYDSAISFKLIGRNVVTISTANPEEIISHLPDKTDKEVA